MIYGYIKTEQPLLDKGIDTRPLQRKALETYGVDEVIEVVTTELISNSVMIPKLTENDTLVVTSIDRLGLKFSRESDISCKLVVLADISTGLERAINIIHDKELKEHYRLGADATTSLLVNLMVQLLADTNNIDDIMKLQQAMQLPKSVDKAR